MVGTGKNIRGVLRRTISKARIFRRRQKCGPNCGRHAHVRRHARCSSLYYQRVSGNCGDIALRSRVFGIAPVFTKNANFLWSLATFGGLSVVAAFILAWFGNAADKLAGYLAARSEVTRRSVTETKK